jgi:uncharacterized integral membrane protein
MTRAILLSLLLFVLALGAAIGFFNAQLVKFNYLVGSAEVPLISLIFGELVLITLVGLAVFASRVWGLKREIRALRKRLAAAEVELRNLRALPMGSAVQSASGSDAPAN